MICKICKKSFKRKMTREIFKKSFKVGDCIIGYATQKRVQITAIGRDRFLYLDGTGREGVGQIESAAANWRKK